MRSRTTATRSARQSARGVSRAIASTVTRILSSGLPELSELRDLVVLVLAPRHFRRRNIRRLTHSDGRDLLLVGTIHQMHLASRHYRLSHLENVVLNYRPERIGIEARPQDLAFGLLGMPPVEMAHIAALARRAGIPVFGFDASDEPAYALAAKSGAPVDFNAPQRNNQMVALLSEGLSSARRVAAFTGYSHVEPFVARLAPLGWTDRESSSGDLDELFRGAGGDDALDSALAIPLERTIASLEAYLSDYLANNGEDAWSRRVQAKLRRTRETREYLDRHSRG
jgi:hypothetical protein